MLKKIGIVVAGLLGLVILLVVAVVVWAHVAIRQERTPLPAVEDVAAAVATNGGPVRLSWINTASQVMPRTGVLDAAADPSPTLPYTMAHPSFVLEWADGRMLLVDSGMTRAGAVEFGAPIHDYAGGEAIRVLTPVAERLGDARARVKGAIFTHLHTDHVGGMPDVCRGRADLVQVFMTDAQLDRPNYTTRPGHALLESTDCVRLERLGGLALKKVEGFPGLFVIAAGGHTPGSEIIVTSVGEGEQRRRVAFVGDIVNSIDGVTYDIPKPFLYRTLVVPEDEERQGELRRWLRDLQQKEAFTLLPAHDQQQIERSGIPAWG